jgi:CRISPR/Cas system-associated exonuclease Cas4 (RecB family)
VPKYFDLFAATGGVKKAKYFTSRPLKFSYSAFKNVSTCPAKYVMMNVLYWTPREIDTRNFCLGSVGHSCLEKWIKQGELKPGYMQSIAQEEFDLYLRKNTVVPLNNRDIHEMREKSVANAQAIEDVFIEYHLHEKTVVSEKKWQVALPSYNNVLLTGILDLLLPEENLILDLKVTKNAAYKDLDQLCIYALMGTLAGFKTRKAGFLVPLRKEKLTEVEFEPADFSAMFHRIQDELVVISNGIQSGRWDYKYNKTSCYRCDVNSFCDAYKVENSPVDHPVFEGESGKIIKF